MSFQASLSRTGGSGAVKPVVFPVTRKVYKSQAASRRLAFLLFPPTGEISTMDAIVNHMAAVRAALSFVDVAAYVDIAPVSFSLISSRKERNLVRLLFIEGNEEDERLISVINQLSQHHMLRESLDTFIGLIEGLIKPRCIKA